MNTGNETGNEQNNKSCKQNHKGFHPEFEHPVTLANSVTPCGRPQCRT